MRGIDHQLQENSILLFDIDSFPLHICRQYLSRDIIPFTNCSAKGW
jgi:hypothetical protein